MHILLTDILTCPRCGPSHGLIVLADRIEDRRVLEGALGCANCRQSYPVRNGIADLRHRVHPPLGLTDPPSEPADDERAYRAAALLGTPHHNATLLILEPAGALAPSIAKLLPDAWVVGGAAGPISESDPAGPSSLSRVRLCARLPFRNGALRGAALLGRPSAGLVGEVVRVLAPGARIVIDRAVPETARELEKTGFKLLLEQEGVVVAAADSPR